MIICPPIRTVCESREILLLPLHVCARARFLLVASLARQSRIIIVPSVPSCIFPSSSSFSFFFSFFFFCFFGERGRHRCALLKAFRIHDSQKLDWNCSNRSPVSSFARIFSRLCIITYSVLYSFIHFRLIPFVDLLFSSPASIERSLGLETDI